MKGTLINAATIIGGAGVGTLLRQGIPERYQQTITQGMGLAVGLIGLQMALKTQNILIVIISIAIGAVLGEYFDLDDALKRLGKRLSGRFGNKYGSVGEGFVTASLVFCVGAMAVVGSVQEGLTGDLTTLYAKSMLDGIMAAVLASSLGIGVAVSGVSVLLYQGSITLMAGFFSHLLSEAAIRELTSVGGLMIIGISLMMMQIKIIKVANLLPAIPVVVAVTYAAGLVMP